MILILIKININNILFNLFTNNIISTIFNILHTISGLNYCHLKKNDKKKEYDKQIMPPHTTQTKKQ